MPKNYKQYRKSFLFKAARKYYFIREGLELLRVTGEKRAKLNHHKVENLLINNAVIKSYREERSSRIINSSNI